MNKIVSKAQDLQNRIESKFKGKELKEKDYFLFLTIVFFITGFMLFVYCILSGIHPLLTDILSSPVFYLIMGSMFSFCYVLKKKHLPKNK